HQPPPGLASAAAAATVSSSGVYVDMNSSTADLGGSVAAYPARLPGPHPVEGVYSSANPNVVTRPPEGVYETARPTAATGIIAIQRLVELLSGDYGIFLDQQPDRTPYLLMQQLLAACLSKPGQSLAVIRTEVAKQFLSVRNETRPYILYNRVITQIIGRISREIQQELRCIWGIQLPSVRVMPEYYMPAQAEIWPGLQQIDRSLPGKFENVVKTMPPVIGNPIKQTYGIQ
ncbi:MAG: hypothetical protein K5Q00_08350, partial [Gammaproteobacteria bacterium]|nr:hypothetical protein [Gammaproteobacteria bacterium]